MKEILKTILGSSLHSQQRCQSCGFTSASQRQLEGVLVSWIQCSLRGCLQGGLKRIKDSDESEAGHFPSLISSRSSAIILTVMGRPAFAFAAFLHFRLHLGPLQKTPFTTLPLVYFAPSPLYHSSITFREFDNPEKHFRVKYLTSRSYITFVLTASPFSTPKLPLQETDSRSLQRNASFTRIVP